MMFSKKYMNRNWYINILFVLLMVFLISGCSSEKKSNKEADTQETSKAENVVRTSEEAKDEFSVNLSIYEAERVSSNVDGSLVQETVPDATAYLREGTDAREGNILSTVQADADGQFHFNLPAGIYTAQIESAGYATLYQTVEVSEQEAAANAYMIPALSEGVMGIVLAWEDPSVDLDLSLVTPYQEEDGSMAYVNRQVMDDGYGSRLLWDNRSGCEVIYINTSASGEFQVFVSDYLNCNGGSDTAKALAQANARVDIYDYTGLVETLFCPADQEGVVWEAAQISGGQITPSQQVYGQPEGKPWMAVEKAAKTTELRIEEEEELQKFLTLLTQTLCCEEVARYTHNFQERAEKLFAGEWEVIHDFLIEYALYDVINEDCSFAYIQRIQRDPALMEMKKQVFTNWLGGAYPDIAEYLTAANPSQLEHIASSITGNPWQLDSLDDIMEKESGYCETNGDYAFFNGDPMDKGGFIRLENYQVEYVSSNTWKITADVGYSHGYAVWSPEIEGMLIGRLTATVVYNPNSCFGGYSVTALDFAEMDGWRKAYYDVLTECVNQGKFELDGYTKCQYAYLDADDIPELIIYSDLTYESNILTYHDGKAVLIDFPFSYGGRYLSFIPKTGLICEDTSGSGAGGIVISQLEGTEVRRLGSGFWQSWTDWDNGGIVYSDWEWNSEEVTPEEYNACIQELLGDQPSEKIIWEYKWIGATDLQYELRNLNPEIY